MNHSNKDGKLSAESEEGRPLIKENTHQASTHSTQSEARVSQGLAGVRKVAGEKKGTKFTALLHHVTVGLLRESFFVLKRKAAPWGRWRHVARVWDRFRGSTDRSAQPGSPRRLSSATIKESVYPET